MAGYYEFTAETKECGGHTLHQIRATKDLPLHNVKSGDVGGWIESEKNLFGNAWVSGDAWVYGDARVFGDAFVYGDALVFGDARVYGDARVFGDALVFGNAWVYGNAWVSGEARVFGNARVSGGAWKTSPLYIQGSMWPAYMSAPDVFTIGCQSHTLEYWGEHYKAMARANHAEDIIGEYMEYYNIAVKRYGKKEDKPCKQMESEA